MQYTCTSGEKLATGSKAAVEQLALTLLALLHAIEHRPACVGCKSYGCDPFDEPMPVSASSSAAPGAAACAAAFSAACRASICLRAQ